MERRNGGNLHGFGAKSVREAKIWSCFWGGKNRLERIALSSGEGQARVRNERDASATQKRRAEKKHEKRVMERLLKAARFEKNRGDKLSTMRGGTYREI